MTINSVRVITISYRPRVLSQLELHRQQHPHRDRLVAATPRLEAPALDGVDRRRVEVGMPGRFAHDDVADAAVRADEDAEQRGALDAGAARAGRIRGLHLIAATRRRALRDTRAVLATIRRQRRDTRR